MSSESGQADALQCLLGLVSIVVVLPSFLFGAANMAVATPTRSPPPPRRSAAALAQAAQQPAAAAAVPAAHPPPTQPRPRSERTFRPRTLLMLLNGCFILLMATLCAVSLLHWAVAINANFKVEFVAKDFNNSTLAFVFHNLQYAIQALYFFVSVWMKHSLVTSLPGVMPHFTIWVVSIFLCLLAAGPVAVYSSFSVASRWSLLATIIVCGCMSSLTWVYIFLAIRNVKEENATIAAALRIVTRKSKLSWWLIYRPILMLLISAGYLAFFILLPQSLDMTAGVAVIVLWDFLFEYKQIQRGLFAKLVREISLPEDARRKLSQARERENAMRKIGDDSNESELYYDDNPADFEFPLDQIAAIRRGRNHDSMKSKISASTSGGLGSAVGPIKTKRESAYTSVGASSSNRADAGPSARRRSEPDVPSTPTSTSRSSRAPSSVVASSSLAASSKAPASAVQTPAASQAQATTLPADVHTPAAQGAQRSAALRQKTLSMPASMTIDLTDISSDAALLPPAASRTADQTAKRTSAFL